MSIVSGIGGVLVAKRRTVVTFRVSFGCRSQKVPTAGIEGVLVAKRKTVITVALALGLRETQNCRHFWIAVGSPRFKRVNSHRDRGSWSRNAELSSLLDSVAKRRKEERGERIEDRGERRGGRRKERGGRRAERGEERRDERGEEKEEKR